MEAVLEAVKRTTKGKNENNRTRAAGQIPAVVYGAQKAGDTVDPVQVAVDPKPFMRILHSKSGRNTLITLKVEGDAEARVLVKEVQLDPITHAPLHADFYRVNMDRTIEVTVPIVLRGEPRGVKVDGGVLDFLHREIQVECLPGEIPNAIEIDISELGLNQSIHLRDVDQTVTWTPLTDRDTMLVHVVAPRTADTAAEGAAPAAGAPEPEVAKKGKPEEAEKKK
ncbi:MAG: 50S ribosomal protein L25 [Vicinamibacterales bacterium]